MTCVVEYVRDVCKGSPWRLIGPDRFAVRLLGLGYLVVTVVTIVTVLIYDLPS